MQVESSPVSRAIGDLLEAIELYVYILLRIRMHIVKEFTTAHSLLHIMTLRLLSGCLRPLSIHIQGSC